jgi:hypothetical protein
MLLLKTKFAEFALKSPCLKIYLATGLTNTVKPSQKNVFAEIQILDLELLIGENSL